MDKEILVKHLREIIKNYNEQGKEFVLFMLIPVDASNFNTSYSILLSAHWLDNMDYKEALNMFIRDIKNQVGSMENPALRLIARINMIHTEDPFVNTITSVFKQTGTETTDFSNINVNGFEIKSGIILVSKHPDRRELQSVPM